jgi:hypothetical protein
MTTPSVCRKEGWLNKTGGSVKTWKTRYFRLLTSTSMLEYAPRQEAGTAILGSIPVKNAVISVFHTDIYKSELARARLRPC